MTKALLAATTALLVLAPSGVAAPRTAPLPPELSRLVSTLQAARAAEVAAKDAYDHEQTAKLDALVAAINARQADAEAALKAAGRAGFKTSYASLVADGLHEISDDDAAFADTAKHPPKELPQAASEVLAGAIARKDELVALVQGYALLSSSARAVQVARLDDVFDDLEQALDESDELRARLDRAAPDDWLKGDGPWNTNRAEAALNRARKAIGGLPASDATLDAAKRIREALDALRPVDGYVDDGERSGELEFQRKADKALDRVRTATQEAMKAVDGALAHATAAPSGARLSIGPVQAVFEESARATTYLLPTVKAPAGQKPAYSWSLRLTAVDPAHGVDAACDNGGAESARTATFVWHHGNKGDPTHDDGCDHELQGRYGHQGVVRVTVTAGGWRCQASYKGTNSSTPDAVAQGVASRPRCAKTG